MTAIFRGLNGRPARVLAAVATLAVAAAWPAIAGNAFLIFVGSFALVFVVLGEALNLVYGYAGFFCLSITVFWSTGGYAAAGLTAKDGITPLLAIIAGAAITGGVAFLFGLLTLHRGRMAFSILSLVLLLFAQTIALSWTAVTGGGSGISGLPPVNVFGLSLTTTAGTYYLALVVTVVSLAILYALVSSDWGRTLRAANRNEVLAASFGVNLFKERLIALTIAGFFCGLVGGVQVFRVSLADSSLLSLTWVAPLLAIIFIGGPGRFFGVLIASVAIIFIPELSRAFQTWQELAYGGVLLAFCLMFPEGIGRPRMPAVPHWLGRIAGAGAENGGGDA